jgi:cytochrome oxidase Cu insertion factor (SCO1/SenC/PrrC family)
MQIKTYTRFMWKQIQLVFVLIAILLLSACTTAAPTSQAEQTKSEAEPVESGASAADNTEATATPEWFDWQNMELTDVATGETFAVNDYAGKVVLLETMAVWCPNCIVQQNEIRKLHESLGNPDDFVSISLDVDLNEDEQMLKEYVEEWGFEWHFAVSPLLVSRGLGNLYSAQYLNPPLAPMMIIDRDGSIEHLPYGVKKLDELEPIVKPYFE